MRPHIYWFRFNGLPVTLHIQRDRRFLWTRILGIQWGQWFVGAIRGTEDPLEAKAE